MRKIILFTTILVFIASCSNEGKNVDGVITYGNDDFNVQLLFEKDGVKIYRFKDGGYSRYFAIGNGCFLAQEQTRTQTNGKTTITTRWSDGLEQ